MEHTIVGHDSVREFLDQQRSGWGARFGAVFEIVGLEAADDLRICNPEIVQEVDGKLASAGAGNFHLQKIREEIEADIDSKIQQFKDKLKREEELEIR